MPSTSVCYTSELQSNTIRNVANSAEENSQSSSAEKDETNRMVSMLQEIFPQKEHCELASASANCQTLQEAIDLVLDSKATEGVESEGLA